MIDRDATPCEGVFVPCRNRLAFVPELSPKAGMKRRQISITCLLVELGTVDCGGGWRDELKFGSGRQTYPMGDDRGAAT